MPSQPDSVTHPPINLWRSPKFLLLWTGVATSQFGVQISGLAIPVIAVTTLAATDFEVGVLGAMQTLAFLLISLPVGAWVDHVRKRRVMIAADVVRAVALGVVPVLWIFGALDIVHLVIIAGVVGAASVFADLAYYSFIPKFVPRRALLDANSKMETTGQVSRIAGPAAAGGLLSIMIAPAVVLVTALTYAVSALVTFFVPDPEARVAKTRATGSMATQIRRGLSFVWHDPVLRPVTITASLTGAASAAVTTVLPLLVLRIAGLNAGEMGLGIAVGAIGGVLGAMALPTFTRVFGEGRAILIPVVGWMLTTCLLPVIAIVPPWAALATFAAIQFASSFFGLMWNIGQLSYRQRITPPAMLGRVNATFRFVVWGTMPVASIAAGVLSAGVGTTWTVAVAGVFGVVSTIPALWSPLRHLRHLPALDTAAITLPTDPMPR